jgi:hypothetical protein
VEVELQHTAAVVVVAIHLMVALELILMVALADQVQVITALCTLKALLVVQVVTELFKLV